MKSGKYINNPILVSTLVNGSKDLYDYYKNNFNIDILNLTSLYLVEIIIHLSSGLFPLNIDKRNKLGGHSVARTHRPTDSNNVIGSYLISKISEKVKNINNIKFFIIPLFHN